MTSAELLDDLIKFFDEEADESKQCFDAMFMEDGRACAYGAYMLSRIPDATPRGNYAINLPTGTWSPFRTENANGVEDGRMERIRRTIVSLNDDYRLTFKQIAHTLKSYRRTAWFFTPHSETVS